MTHEHNHDHAPIEAADEISEFDVLETAVRELAIEKGLFSADDRVAGHDRGQCVLGPSLGPLGAHR